jgi:hypothetical protein
MEFQGNTELNVNQVHFNQCDEIKRCEESFLYFVDTYCYIQDRKTKQAIPFKLWPGQAKVAPKLFLALYLLILKARQLGLTWLVAAYALWRAIFHFEELIVIISAREDLAIEFLDRIKFIFDRLPAFMKPTVMKRTTTELHFGIETKDIKGNIKIGGLNSVIKSIASTPDAGQSKTISLLILDESALNRYCKEIWSAAKPTLEHAGGQAIIISNPSKDKPGWGWTRDLYIDSMKGLNEFDRLFLNWECVPGRGEGFLASQKRAGLDDADISMQYPTTETEAIEALGGNYFGDTTKRFEAFPGEKGVLLLTKKDEGTKEVERVDFQAETSGILEVWEHPQKNWEFRYAIGSDVSEGLGETYSVAYVYDRLEKKFVARMRSNRIDADIWGTKLIELGKYYNNAMIGPERNGAGITTIIKLQRSLYPFLFYRQRPGKMKGDYVKEYGWLETNENKQILADELKRHFRDIFSEVPCQYILSEAATFIRHENGELRHEDGKLDDCVIAGGITIQVSIMMPPVKNITKPRPKSFTERRIEMLERGEADDFESYLIRNSIVHDLDMDFHNMQEDFGDELYG